MTDYLQLEVQYKNQDVAGKPRDAVVNFYPYVSNRRTYIPTRTYVCMYITLCYVN